MQALIIKNIHNYVWQVELPCFMPEPLPRVFPECGFSRIRVCVQNVRMISLCVSSQQCTVSQIASIFIVLSARLMLFMYTTGFFCSVWQHCLRKKILFACYAQETKWARFKHLPTLHLYRSQKMVLYCADMLLQ